MSIPLSSVNIVELAVRGQMAAGGSDTQVIDNICHFRRTATVVDPVKQHIVDAFKLAILDPIKALVSSDWSVPTVGARYVEDADDPEVPLTPGAGVVGAVATDRCPDHIAVSWQLGTARRGRSFKGRKSWAGICEADTTKDLIAAGSQAAWAAAAAAYLAGFTDSDGNVWVPFLLSRKLSQLKTNPTTVTGADITKVTLRKSLGSMNSRKVATVV